MFEAQYLYKGSGVAVYGPWMSRGGDNLVATLDVLAITGSTTLTVTVFTKESESEGDGTVVTGSIAATAIGPSSQSFVGSLDDLVRYKFAVTGSNATDYALFRMIEPTWYDSVDTV